ncbi:MFS transporter [Jannaschia sp. LMIT008]|uniref:MFS transporter n=1 Tax=Jannaschia maritima TaxID=3032585 RepID=UPI002810F874|nr:MFS transporter [Jannaschia sp. LMIT008]
MWNVLSMNWALLLGVMFLMIGNGMQGTLLGVRGGLEGFSTGAMSIVMAAYFAGFLLGSQTVPDLIRRVGHVRVFAALGSLASACLVLFPVITTEWAWAVLRLLLGFCFCGVYIVAESWLNDTTTNETRGRALSLYLIAQSVGIVAAQGIFALGDPADFQLFVIVSVLVSLAFAPILLSATPMPPFESTKPMSFLALYRVSPLGFVGVFILGGVFAGLFGMTGVFGAARGLTSAEIALFVATIYVGGMVLQYPIGWASDRYDRRKLMVAASLLGAGASILGYSGAFGLPGLLLAGFVVGGVAMPLYGLLLAYTNDYLDRSDMASASARLLFVNGLGAIGGPLVTGWLMDRVGAGGFFLFIAMLLAAMALYAMWRMTRRPAYAGDESAPYVAVATAATPVTIGTLVEEWEEQIGADPAPGGSADAPERAA